MRRSFRSGTHHCVTISRMETSSLEIGKSTTQLISALECVRTRMGLQLFHKGECRDRNEGADVILFKALVVHVTLQSARCIFCNVTVEISTKLRTALTMLSNYVTGTLGL